MKRYCQTLDLKEDEQLIKEYCYWHSPEHIWPEIPEGIRAVGILNMEIYRLGTRLFMIVETPDDFDWDAAFTRLATMDKQAEWEDFVAKYQKAAPGSSSSEKWQLMECMFNCRARVNRRKDGKTKETVAGGRPGREILFGPIYLDHEFVLALGIRPRTLGCAEQAFPRSLHDDQGRERLGAILYVYRLFLDGVAGGSVHETLRI